MPLVKIISGRQPLTIPQLRVLAELAGGAALRRGLVEDRAGGSAALAELKAQGLVVVEELDIDGLIERAWRITPSGKDRLAASAGMAKSAPSANGRKEKEETPTIAALAPWFGSARRYAEAVAQALKGCSWVVVPFAGGLSEVPAILAAGVNAMALNDKHTHQINLARCVADPELGPMLYKRLRRQPFCSKVLEQSQDFCAQNEPDPDQPDAACAFHYFISAWMARSGEAGKAKELGAGLAIRYGAGGGNSVLRYANAVGGLRAWQRILSRCSFSADDAFDFLKRCNDRDDAGVYADPPWPGPGKAYLYQFGEREHLKLSAVLEAFAHARIVVRSGGGPLAEKLYNRRNWTWLEAAGRSQANKVSTEFLICRNMKKD